MLNFGTGRVSVLKIMIKISIEVIIPILGYVKRHVGTGGVSVVKIIIKIAISHEPH